MAQVPLSEEIMRELLLSGRTKEKVIGFVSKAGSTFDACLKLEDDRIRFDFDNPSSGAAESAQGSYAERPFYEELADGASVPVPKGAQMPQENQHTDTGEDVPAFYDSMAEELAAYQELEEEEQIAGENFLDLFLTE